MPESWMPSGTSTGSTCSIRPSNSPQGSIIALCVAGVAGRRGSPTSSDRRFHFLYLHFECDDLLFAIQLEGQNPTLPYISCNEFRFLRLVQRQERESISHLPL